MMNASSVTDASAIRAQLDAAMKAMPQAANPHGLTGVDSRGNSLGGLPVAVVQGGRIREVKLVDLR
jgi:branched-chain amino acid transport system substrate-binding protein